MNLFMLRLALALVVAHCLAGCTSSPADSDPARMPATQSSPRMPTTRPYVPTSFKGLTDAEIIRYMGPSEWVPGPFSGPWYRVPDRFWQVTPKAAALALVEGNRADSSRRRYRLAVEESDGKAPPQRMTVSFRYFPNRSGLDNDRSLFLCADPRRSYLAYTEQPPEWMAKPCAFAGLGSYGLKVVELKYSEAHHLASVIWWLHRVRPVAEDDRLPARVLMTTADAGGAIVLQADELIGASSRLVALPLRECLDEDFSSMEFVKTSYCLLWRYLPEYLGDRWEPRQHQPSLWERVIATRTQPALRQDLIKQRTQLMSANVTAMLDLLSDEPLADDVLADVVQAAADSGLTALQARLEKLQQRAAGTATQPATAEQGQKAVGLQQEAHSRLSDSLALALRKLKAIRDAEALEAWARRPEDPAKDWALWHLAHVDKSRYVALLKERLLPADAWEGEGMLEDIEHVAPEQAVAIATTLPAGPDDKLTLEAFRVLDQAGTMPDRDKRIDVLIQIATNPHADKYRRSHAVELLVPEDAPMKHPAKKVDDALARLLEPSMHPADELWALHSAIHALSLRGRREHFDKILEWMKTAKDASVIEWGLCDLVRLTADGPVQQRNEVAKVLEAELSNSRFALNEALLLLYAMDLREMQPRMENLETSGPDEAESELANSHYMSAQLRPVSGRFRVARQVAAIWNEKDAVTRMKLIVAFGCEHPYSQEGLVLQRATRQLAQTARQVESHADRAAVASFITYCEKNYHISSATAADSPIVQFLRAAKTLISAR